MQISGSTAHNITNVNARLGPLAHNGGLTQTHELLDGSPAIDAGLSSLLTDQRGSTRPLDNPAVSNAAGGNASDIGAYETPVFEVNSTADTNDGACTLTGAGNGCTLREAIFAANTTLGAETITFKPALTASGPATITLLSALPELDSDMTMVGPGRDLLTIQRSTAPGTPNFRLFTIHAAKNVELSGLTIANGHASAQTNGGGVRNNGALTMRNCNVYGNSAGTAGVSGLGGGIYICDDADNEDTETINLILSSPTGSGALGTPATSVWNITNNDAPVLLVEAGQRAVALDSVIQMRDPFSLLTLFNFSSDQRRRVSLFVWRLGMLPGDTAANITVTAEDDEGRVYPLTVEHVGPLPEPAGVVQINVILPQQVIGAPRDLGIKVQLRGPASNQGFIKIL